MKLKGVDIVIDGLIRAAKPVPIKGDNPLLAFKRLGSSFGKDKTTSAHREDTDRLHRQGVPHRYSEGEALQNRASVRGSEAENASRANQQNFLQACARTIRSYLGSKANCLEKLKPDSEVQAIPLTIKLSLDEVSRSQLSDRIDLLWTQVSPSLNPSYTAK